MSLSLPGLRELASHCITAFPGKLEGVLHSQKMALICFKASCMKWVNYVRFITNIHNFSKFSKIAQSSKQNFRGFAAIMSISQKVFLKSPSRCISSCQQDKNWINFPSKMPTVEQLFCRSARWVLLSCNCLLYSFLIFMTFCVRFYIQNIHVYTEMKRQSSRPNCVRTGNHEIMNANYELDDQ